MAKKKTKQRLKVRKNSGSLIDYPEQTIKKTLALAGFTGKHLLTASTGVFKEAKKLAKAGVINATNLEKAVLKSAENTNRIIMGTTKKITKKILK